jgi:hypothetical protein
MQDTTRLESRSPPHHAPAETRAWLAAHNTTAEPPLASGLGDLIDKEHALRSSIADRYGLIGGKHAAELARILRRQESQLDANIALLEQRYEGISTGEAPTDADDGDPSAPSRPASYEAGEVLRDLGVRHASLLADIDSLLERAPDGRRGELILTEVKRNHEEMAWVLNALLSEDVTAARAVEDQGGPAAGTMSREQENWDNEGGPERTAPHDG